MSLCLPELGVDPTTPYPWHCVCRCPDTSTSHFLPVAPCLPEPGYLHLYFTETTSGGADQDMAQLSGSSITLSLANIHGFTQLTLANYATHLIRNLSAGPQSMLPPLTPTIPSPRASSTTTTDASSPSLMAPGMPPTLCLPEQLSLLTMIVFIGTHSPYCFLCRLDSNWSCRQPVVRRSLTGSAPARSLCERFVGTNVDGAPDQEAALSTSRP